MQLVLWHFAGRWGEVHSDERSVSLTNITGETLAKVVGARRQSVSTALGALADRGVIRRLPNGSLMVHRRPALLEDVLALEPGAVEDEPAARRATDD